MSEEKFDNNNEEQLNSDNLETESETPVEEVSTEDTQSEETNEDVQAELTEDEQKIVALEKELESAQEKTNEALDRLLRVQADFENFKRRTQKEKGEVSQYTLESFISKLLPVLDNFDLALGHSDTDNLEAYRKGVELVSKQLNDVLQSEGLKEIAAQGEAFDPNFHHGVAVDNNPDVDDQQITEVFQKGYELKGKVIRPSMVKVNQN